MFFKARVPIFLDRMELFLPSLGSSNRMWADVGRRMLPESQ